MMTDTTLVLTGGTVHTLDPLRPRAGGLAVDDGRIVALDPQPEGASQTIDLRGRAVLPGFIDAHLHFGAWALARQQVDLEPSASVQDALDLLRAAAARLPEPTTWLRGRGWDRNRWGQLPTAAELDAAIGDRPAVLSSRDGHALWVNTPVLRRAEIDPARPDPPGGAIERDARGEPSGVVFENARDLVWRVVPPPSIDELTAVIRAGLPLAAAAGLTGVHSFEDERSLEAFHRLDATGELSLRVWHGVPRRQLRDARQLGLRTGVGSDLVQVGPVKLFADGALGSRTAYLLEPYAGRADGYRGLPTLQPEELRDDLRVAAEAGLDIAIHAIGDAAVRGVLDAVEHSRAELGDRMVRIEHAQLVDPADVPRFAALGVVASMQPSHAVSDWRVADAHWGARARHGYAWRTLLTAGARLAFGTDAPVERIEPLPSLHAAVTRRDALGEPLSGWYPEERLTLLEAVRAYTLGAAQAGRADHRRGSLSMGKEADLVVLSADPFAVEPGQLREVQVELTMVGGRIVYQR
jgi:predicted amidohydrolase YtcJ